LLLPYCFSKVAAFQTPVCFQQRGWRAAERRPAWTHRLNDTMEVK
jgi:hypothetical protein